VVPDLLHRFQPERELHREETANSPPRFGFDTNLSQPKDRNPAITREDAVGGKKKISEE
jgi:hypothetical protein